jgi:hypothetical protein
MTRFCIDHGVIHDHVTGKHVKTDGEPPFEDSVEQVCDLLNSLAPRRCDTNVVAPNGECIACNADNGVACRGPALTGKNQGGEA